MYHSISSKTIILILSLQVFNYRLSRGRRLIENTFGILTATWRILLRRIDLQPEKVKSLTMACCILHNFLRISKPAPQGGAPSENQEWSLKNEELNDIGNIAVRPTAAAAAVRDNFCTYFNTIGSVPWQNRMVFGGNQEVVMSE